MPSLAIAQVVVADTATAISTNPNGVPVVDIAAANAVGISHNKFTDYNVGTKGLVLNNGAADAATHQSQLAGMVKANPNLGQNAAKLILNEVTSTNRSVIEGFTEVVGTRADVIVANPNGITCGGCGFINAPSVTMTTGRPTIGADGQLTGLRVTGGDILVTGNGLNATAQDYLALVARRIRIEAPINAGTLDLVGGAGTWNVADRTQSAIAGDANTPLGSIDSVVLGGAYAGRVRLIVTEAGAGVTMAGDMAATAGDFTIDTAGKVQLSGALSAKGRIVVTTRGSDLALSGARLTSSDAMALDAGRGAVSLTGGTLSAGTGLTLTGGSLADTVSGGSAADAGKRFAGGDVTLKVAGAAAFDGANWGSNALLALDSGSIAGVQGTLYGSTVQLTSATGDLALGTMQVKASGALSLTAFAKLTSAGTLQSVGGDLSLTAADLASTGTLSADAGNAVLGVRNAASIDGTLQAGKTLMLSGGAFTTKGIVKGIGGITLDLGNLTNAAALQTPTLTGTLGGFNNSAEIVALKEVTLTSKGSAAAFANTTDGTIRTAKLAISAGQGAGAPKLTNAGKLLAETAALSLGGLSNPGRIETSGTLTIANSGTAQNDGTVLAGGDLVFGASTLTNAGSIQGLTVALTTGALVNSGTITLATGAGSDIRLSATSIDNRAKGVIQGAGSLTVDGASSIANAGTILAASDLAIIGAGTGVALSSTSDGLFQAGKTLTVTRGGAVDLGGAMSADTLRLSLGGGSASGQLQANSDLLLDVSGTLKSSGTISAKRGLTVTGDSLTNAGILYAGDTLAVTLKKLTNTVEGGIQGSAGSTIEAGMLANDGRVVLTNAADKGGKLTLGAFTNTGSIQSAGDLTLALAGAGDNSGTLLAVKTMTVSGAGTLTSRGDKALLEADGTFTADASGLTLDVQGGRMLAGTLAAKLAAFNAGGKVQTSGNLTLETAGNATIAGSLLSVGTGTLKIGGTLTNSGELQVNGGLTLTAGGLANRGSIFGASKAETGTKLTVGTLKNDQGGTIYAPGALALTVGNTLDNAGRILAQGALNVDGAATAATNQQSGEIRSAGALSWNMSGGSLTQSGTLGADTITLRLGSLAGTGATQSVGALTVDASGDAGVGGLLLAGSTLTVRATSLTNSGGVQGASGTTLAVSTLNNLADGKIVLTGGNGGAGSIEAATITNAGSIQSPAAMTLTATTLNNSGTILGASTLDLLATSGGSLTVVNDGSAAAIQAGTVLTVGPASGTSTVSYAGAAGAVLNARTIKLNLSSFSNGGTIQTQDALTLVTGGPATVTSTGQVLSLGTTDISATKLVNTGAMELRGAATFALPNGIDNGGVLNLLSGGYTLSFASILNRSGGTIHVAGATVLAAPTIDNAGTIVSDGALTIQARAGETAFAFSNQATGAIGVTGALTFGSSAARGSFDSTVGSKLIVSSGATIWATNFVNRGLVQAAGATALDVATMSGQGSLLAAGALTVNASQGVTVATGGVLQGDTVTLRARNVQADGTLNMVSGASGTGTITADDLTVGRDGRVQSRGGLTLTLASSLRNNGLILANELVDLRPGGSGFRFDMGANSAIRTSGAFTLNLPTLDLTLGSGATLVAKSVGLTVKSLTSGATIQADEDLTINAGTGSVSFNQGTVYAGTTATITSGQTKVSSGVVLQGATGVTINTGDFNGDGTVIGGREGTGSTADTAGRVAITATNVDFGGAVRATDALSISGTTSFRNAGLIYGKGQVTTTLGDNTKTLLNTGTMYGKNISIVANNLTNDTTGIIQATADFDFNPSLFINRGLLRVDAPVGTYYTQAYTLLNEASGIIQFGSSSTSFYKIFINGLTNRGSIQSLGSLEIKSTGTLTNDAGGKIIAAGDLDLISAISSTSLTNIGRIEAGGRLAIGGAINFGAVNLGSSGAGFINARTGGLNANLLVISNGVDASGAGITTSGAFSVNIGSLVMAGENSFMVLGSGSSLTLTQQLSNYGLIYSPGNLQVKAAGIINNKKGGLAASGRLTVDAGNQTFNNWGTIYGKEVVLSNISNFTNYWNTSLGMGEVEADDLLSITASTILNNNIMKVGGSSGTMTLNGTIRNEITGGDTRVWNYGNLSYGYQINTHVAGNVRDTLGNLPGDITAALPGTYTNGQTGYTFYGYNLNLPEADATYKATWSVKQNYATDPATIGKPQLSSNGTMTLNGSVTNMGGSINSKVLNFSSSSVTNDNLAIVKQDWEATWRNEGRCPGGSVSNCNLTWSNYQNYQDSIKTTTNIGSVASTISAGTVTGYIGTLVQTGSYTTTSVGALTKDGKPAGGLSSAGTGAPGAATSVALATVPGQTGPVGGSTVNGSTSSIANVATQALQQLQGATGGGNIDPGKALTSAETGTGATTGIDPTKIATVTGATLKPGQTATVSPISQTGQTLTIQGVTVNLPSSPNALYVNATSPNATYLIESNPRYTRGSTAVSSDVIARELGINPDTLLRRLGDGAYEQFLITQQVVAATGTAALVRAETSDQQVARLMGQSVTAAKAMGLVYGQALSSGQIAGLNQDIVWMVETEVQGTKVLAPVVYLSSATKAMFASGNATFAADVIDLNVGSVLNNGGAIVGSKSLALSATGDITNIGGMISGGNVALTSSGGSIVTRGIDMQAMPTGGIFATGSLALVASKDISVIGSGLGSLGDTSLKAGSINFGTMANRSSDTVGGTTTKTMTEIGSTLGVGGNLTMTSDGDTTFRAAQVDVGGNADVQAGGRFNILAGQNTVETNSRTIESGLGVGGGLAGTTITTTESFSGRNVASNFNVGGNLIGGGAKGSVIQGSNVTTGGDIDLGGRVAVLQGNDVDRTKTTIDTKTVLRVTGKEDVTDASSSATAIASARGMNATASAKAAAATSNTSAGDIEFTNNTRTVTEENQSNAVGSSIKSGGRILLGGAEGTVVQGSSIDSEKGVVFRGKDVALLAAENTYSKTTTTTSESTGLMAKSENTAGANAGASATVSLTSQAKANAGANAQTDNTVDLYRTSTTTTTTNRTTNTGSSITSRGGVTLAGEDSLKVIGSSIDAAGPVLLQGKTQTFGAAIDRDETKTTTERTSAGLYANANANAQADTYVNQIGAQASAGAGAEGGIGLTATHSTSTSTDGSTTAVVSSIKSGSTITRIAEGKISDEGTNIESAGNFVQSAGSYENKAARDTTYSSSSSQTDTGRIGAYVGADAGATAGAGAGGATGAGASASAGVKVSYEHQADTSNASTSTARVGTIKSGGGVSMTSVGKTTLEGTNIQAAGDVDLTAGSLDYTAARNTQTSSSTSTSGSLSAKIGIDVTKAARAEINGSYNGSQQESDNSQAVAGTIGAGGNLTVRTTQGDANFEGTKLAAAGTASVDSAGSVNMTAARDTNYSKTDTQNASLTLSTEKSARGGVDASAGLTHDMEKGTTAQVGSITGGNGVSVTARKDVVLEGTKVDAGAGTEVIKGDRSTSRVAAANTSEIVSFSAELAGSHEGTQRGGPAAGNGAGSTPATPARASSPSTASPSAPARPASTADAPEAPRARAASAPEPVRQGADPEPAARARAVSAPEPAAPSPRLADASSAQMPARTPSPVATASSTPAPAAPPAAGTSPDPTPDVARPNATANVPASARPTANAPSAPDLRAANTAVEPAPVSTGRPASTASANAPEVPRPAAAPAADAPAAARGVALPAAPDLQRAASTPEVPGPRPITTPGASAPVTRVADAQPTAAPSAAVRPASVVQPAATTAAAGTGSTTTPAARAAPAQLPASANAQGPVDVPSTTPSAGSAPAQRGLANPVPAAQPADAGRVILADASSAIGAPARVATPTPPAATAVPPTASGTPAAAPVRDPSSPEVKIDANVANEATRERGVAISRTAEQQAFVDTPATRDRATQVTDRPFVEPAKPTDAPGADNGNRARSNDVTAKPMTLAEINRAERQDQMSAYDAGENRWTLAQGDLRRMLEQSPKAKEEADAISTLIAKEYNGSVSKAPPKSENRALEKIIADYGGDASRIKDLARNTIIVPGGNIGDVVGKLRAEDPNAIVKIVDGNADPMGYSGANVVIKTPSGLTAEIQVNSARMIYAKEGKETAEAIIGKEEYARIAKETGAEGGLGHKFYEDWRKLDPGSPKAKEIAAESRDYYAKFRTPIADGVAPAPVATSAVRPAAVTTPAPAASPNNPATIAAAVSPTAASTAPEVKIDAGVANEPTRERGVAISRTADERAFEDTPATRARGTQVTARPYVEPAKATDGPGADNGNRERSNDVTARPMTLTEINRAERQGALSKYDAGESRWVLAQGDLRQMLEQSPKAKEEADAISTLIAKEYNGSVSKAPPKSENRALEKIVADYGGDASRIKDLARNTIIVPGGNIGDVVGKLRAEDPNAIVKIVDGNADPMGYSGANVVIKTPSGLTAEIQVNSARMIYAKEGRETAEAIIGKEEYARIAKETGVEGGLGHKFYEDWRKLDPGSAKAGQIAAESRDYYAKFRTPAVDASSAIGAPARVATPTPPAATAVPPTASGTPAAAPVRDPSSPEVKIDANVANEATRERGVAISRTAEQQAFVDTPATRDRATQVTDRPYVEPAKPTDAPGADNGNRARSNDVTAKPMTLAEINRAERQDQMSAYDAGENRWTLAQGDLRRMLEQSPKAKEEADAISTLIAKEYNGSVSKAPPKSENRALEKIIADYGGDASRIKDLARNTIIVPGGNIGDVVGKLRAEDPNAIVKIVDGNADPMGYSGANVVIKTPSGLTAEIQVNSARMIYAKEGKETAEAIIGKEEYARIAKETGAEGGLGHKFYEDWRKLDPGSPKAKEIAAESRDYYAKFR